jgi:hypothetical protein
MKHYYAFEYWGGDTTTTGDPNPMTGRYSIAGALAVFSRAKDRDKWIAGGPDFTHKRRAVVTQREARRLRGGWTPRQFAEYLENVVDFDLP